MLLSAPRPALFDLPRPRLTRLAGLVVLVTCLISSLASPAAVADVGSTVRWDMNEGSSSSVMSPEGAGPVGIIGSDVRTGRSVMGATAYGFPYISPNKPPARPEHIVTVPDDPSLDPGVDTYTVTIRVRSQQNFGNVLQKGQAKASGGMWKFQMPNGVMQCLFRGSNGTRTATSVQPINDGAWHVISCERSANAVTMTVDGKVTNRRAGATGAINNDWELSIGGKPRCDQKRVTCDYFVGAMDWVEITKG